MYIFAGFGAGNDQAWSVQRSAALEVGVDQEVTVNLTLNVPIGKHTRVLVQVVDDGYAVDQSYPDWIDT